MHKELRKLILPPGHWLAVEDSQTLRLANQKKGLQASKKLNIFKDPDTAKKVYAIYAKSWNNATNLLLEARSLYQNDRYARCVALGITAWEELGKSQIAADYYTGLLSEESYKDAFREHGLKTSYLVRTGLFDGSGKFKIASDTTIGKKLERIRQDALYVSESSDPAESYTREDAEFILDRVLEHREYIRFAEELNGRIGSKALFK